MTVQGEKGSPIAEGPCPFWIWKNRPHPLITRLTHWEERPRLADNLPTLHQTPGVCVCVIPSVCVTPGEYVGGCACVLCHVRLSLAPCTVAHEAPLSMGFPRQEYWSELPFPPQGDLPHPGSEPASLGSPALAGRFFTTGSLAKSHLSWVAGEFGCSALWPPCG